MKKLIICCLSLALLCGCSTNTDTNQTTTEATSVQTTQNTSESSGTNVAETTLEATGVNSGNYSTDKVVWGPGNTVDHQRPSDPVSLQTQYGSLGAKFILNDEKTVCLTFDEGYENGYTPSILDTLKEKNTKAIFFVTYDFAVSNPELIRRMIDEGHIVGNHTYRHYTMDEISEEEAAEEIMYLHQYMLETFDYKMTLFRFPKGEFSEATLALAKSLNYQSVFWSFAYADWDTENVSDPDEAFSTITESTHNGAIFLLHAVSSTNAQILGDVIDNIYEQGYTFTVDI